MSDPPTGTARTRFRAVLRPHRSLGRTGFLVLMSAVALVSFAAGVIFYAIGAWPVMGFFGLDVLLIYAAFRLNDRAGRLTELVDLGADSLVIKRIEPSGRSRSWQFNPFWVRVELRELRGGVGSLTLASKGERLILGAFLSDPERRSFAAALSEALALARDARGDMKAATFVFGSPGVPAGG